MLLGQQVKKGGCGVEVAMEVKSKRHSSSPSGGVELHYREVVTLHMLLDPEHLIDIAGPKLIESWLGVELTTPNLDQKVPRQRSNNLTDSS